MTQPAKLRFDDDGALCVSGDLSIQQTLESVDRQLGRFIESVRSLELSNDAHYLVRDDRLGLHRGIWILWEDMLLLAMTGRTLCCQELSGDTGVVIGEMKTTRGARPLADALSAVVSMFVKNGDAWPERIPASTVDRLDRIKKEFDSWIAATAPETTTPAEDHSTVTIEERDAEGFVVEPLDPSAYTPMVKVLKTIPGSCVMDMTKLARMLDRNTETIRQWRPSGRRRSIHAGDWNRALDRWKAAVAEGIATDDDFEVLTDAELERRKAEIRAKRLDAKQKQG